MSEIGYDTQKRATMNLEIVQSGMLERVSEMIELRSTLLARSIRSKVSHRRLESPRVEHQPFK